jgi:two-component system, OmpR family, alkaline phosphatase synthesis response regulator PhoP
VACGKPGAAFFLLCLKAERSVQTVASVWIVEDEEAIGILIADIITDMGHRALRLYDAFELEKQLKKDVPDLLLLDLMLRGKNGFAILAQWKQSRDTKHIPAVIISARSAEADKVRGLDLGAEDYIAKPFGVRELKARITAALRRIAPAALEITAGRLILHPDTREAFVDGSKIDMTWQEFELLQYLAMRKGQAVTREQLLREVWGYQYKNDPSRTVDWHIRELRLKLHDDADHPVFIETVRKIGYRLVSGD